MQSFQGVQRLRKNQNDIKRATSHGVAFLMPGIARKEDIDMQINSS